MNNNVMNGITIFMLVGMAVILAWFYKHEKKEPLVDAPIVQIDTISTLKVDTIRISKTITRYKPQPTRVDTIYKTDTINNEIIKDVHKVYECDSSLIVCNDTDSAKVDYHLYIGTNNYDVDSIGLKFNLDYPRKTETKYITKEITKYKKQHFTYGIQTGVGYGIFTKKPDVFIGVGGQYKW